MRIDCIVCFNFFHYGTVLARLAEVAGVSYKRRAPPRRSAAGARTQWPAGCGRWLRRIVAWRIHACVHSFLWNQFGDHI